MRSVVGSAGFGDIEDATKWTHHRSRCGPGGAMFLSGGGIVSWCSYAVHTFDFPEIQIGWSSDRCVFCTSGANELKSNPSLSGDVDEEKIESALVDERKRVWDTFVRDGNAPVGFEGYGRSFGAAVAEKLDRFGLIDLTCATPMSFTVGEVLRGPAFITNCNLSEVRLVVRSGPAEIQITNSKVQRLSVDFPDGEKVSLTVVRGSTISELNIKCSSYKHIVVKESQIGKFSFGKLEKINSTVVIDRSRVLFEGGDFRESTFLTADGLILSSCLVSGSTWMAPQITSWQKLKISYNRQSGFIFGLLLAVSLVPVFSGLSFAVFAMNLSDVGFYELSGTELKTRLLESICEKRECSSISLLRLITLGREFSFASVTNIFLILVNILRFSMVIWIAQLSELERASGMHPRHGSILPRFSRFNFEAIRSELSGWRTSYAPLVFGDKVLKFLLMGALFAFTYTHGDIIFGSISLPEW